MNIPLRYIITDKNKKEIESGKAKAAIGKEELSVTPDGGNPIYLSLRDILRVTACEYAISVSMPAGEIMALTELGYNYESFAWRLFSNRNELILNDMLVKETPVISADEAEFIYAGAGGAEIQKGECGIKLFKSVLVLTPQKSSLIKIPYGEIDGLKSENYLITVKTSDNENITVSKLGYRFDAVRDSLAGMVNGLLLEVQASLKQLMPDADPFVLRKAAAMMKDGRAVRKADLDSIDPGIWTQLDKKLALSEIKEEYAFLKSVSKQENICIGIKRGLMGGLTGNYVWLLFPVYDSDIKKPGNIVVMESVSIQEEAAQTEGEAEGKATYFFRIASRKEYPAYQGIGIADAEIKILLKNINRGMISINFRREPIYMTDEKIEQSDYKFAVRRIPELKMLRELFVGRVIHSSPEQWKQDTQDLMEFNVKTADDNIRWMKAEAVEEKPQTGGTNNAGI